MPRIPKAIIPFLTLLCLDPVSPAAGASTWRVDGATSPSADGLTWATAKRTIQEAVDADGGEVGLTWTDESGTWLAQYLAFAYDVYANQFVSGGWGGTIWFPFPFPALSGEMNVVQSGAYHAWISGQWPDGAWLPCLNPQTLAVHSGRPHLPSGAWAEDRGGGTWRLHWAPEFYGTWLAQILVYQDGPGWITPLDGPSSAFPQLAPWTFVDYGGLVYDPAKASFFQGWADFTLPPGVPLTFYLNFRAWDGQTQGPFAAAAAR